MLLLHVSDTGRNRTDARKLSKSLTMDVQMAKSSLGMIEENDSDEEYYKGKSKKMHVKSSIETRFKLFDTNNIVS